MSFALTGHERRGGLDGEERGPGRPSAGLQRELPLGARCVERSPGPGAGGGRAFSGAAGCCALLGGCGRPRRSAGMGVHGPLSGTAA